MKIIVVGAGKVGYSVAKILSEEGHDITVIDRDPETITHLSNELDVICVEGSATNHETLLGAGAAEADLLMAATQQDEVNMVCGITARKLGTKHVIARIRDTEYLRQTEFLREVLGLSITINPEYECAKEIARILRFPSAARVDTFSKGSVEIVEHRVREHGKLDGMQLKDLSSVCGAKVLVSVVERGGEAIIPNGEFNLHAGDRLSITGATKELRKFFMAMGQYKRPVRNVMIMGGSRIAVYLTRLLQESGIGVSVIDRNPERCEHLCDILPGANIVCGDATRSEVLLEEGIRTTDALREEARRRQHRHQGQPRALHRDTRKLRSRLHRHAEGAGRAAARALRPRDARLDGQQHGDALPPCRRQGRGAGIPSDGGRGLHRHPAQVAEAQAERAGLRCHPRRPQHNPRRRNHHLRR